MNKRTDIGPFAIVPEWLLNSVSGFVPLKVWFILARYANVDGVAWPSQETIAARIGCGIASVKRAIQELESLGAITVAPRIVPGKGKVGNLYRVIYSQSIVGDTTATRSAVDDTSAGITGDTSVNKDEREPILTLTINPPTPQTEITLSKQEAPNSENGHTPIPESPNPKEKALRAESIGEPDPEWADLWAEWLDDRKKRRLPNTALALNKQLELLRRDPNPRDVLETAMRCTWKGLFPSKKDKKKQVGLMDQINNFLGANS